MPALIRIILPLFATILLAVALSQRASATAHAFTANDCAVSGYDLDCACVKDKLARAGSGLSAEQRGLLSQMTRLMIGASTQAVPSDNPEVLMAVMGVMGEHGLMDLPQTCKAKGGGIDPLASTAREDIRALCERSRHIVDCDCVGFQYAKAANNLPPGGQDFARAVLGQQLGVETSPAYDAIPATTMIQNAEVMTTLAGTARSCATPTPSALAAYRNATTGASHTLQARASAAPADALRLWCEAFGGSAAQCACQVQVTRDLLSERTFRFHGESMKAQALVELGRLQGTERFAHAARAMGADSHRALYVDTGNALEGVSQIADNVCNAVEQEVTAAR